MTRQQHRFIVRKGERTVGFTAVSNKRNDAFRASVFVMQQTLGIGSVEANAAAWRALAKRLPAAPMVNAYRIKSSKSDNLAWRKPCGERPA